MSFSSLSHIPEIMKDYNGWWAVTGGWAIDLFIGQQSRPHKDIEIAVLRSEQHLLRAYLKGWSWRYVVEGQFFSWGKDQHLALPIHELYANKGAAELEVLLNESSGNDWAFRRNTAISLPMEMSVGRSKEGIPYLAPEIVLLFKAKYGRPEDQHDFEAAWPLMGETQKEWYLASKAFWESNS